MRYLLRSHSLVSLFLLKAVFVYHPASSEPCTSYQELNQARRSAAAEVGPGGNLLCDNTLPKGWYRFISYVGGEIPTTCVQPYHCGTQVPIWMNGTLPTDSTVVNRTVCPNYGVPGNCCPFPWNIQVKRCVDTQGLFYVYELVPPTSCSQAYCAVESVDMSREDQTPRRFVDLRTKTRLGTWNVLSMREEGSAELVARELNKVNLSITALTEVRWPGSGELCTEGISFIYSGRTDGHHLQGVALALDRNARNALSTWDPVSERILKARLIHRYGYMTVISAYAPTNAHSDADKDAFYNLFSDVLAGVDRRDLTVVMGDFNATTGTDRSGYEQCIGPHGHGTRNDNGERMLQLCQLHHLKVCGTYFKRKTIHRLSWYSNDGHTKKEIDHILTNHRWNCVQNCRVYRSAEFGNTDHRLVVASCKISLKNNRPSGQQSFRTDVTKLRNPAYLQKFREEINRRYTNNQSAPPDVESVWTQFKDNISDTARSVLGKKTRNHKPWISEDTLRIVEARRQARLIGDITTYRALNSRRQALLRRDKQLWLLQTAEEVEAASAAGRSKAVYEAVRKLAGKTPPPAVGPVVAEDGSPLPTTQQQMDRWKEYYSSLLNRPAPSPTSDLLDELADAATPDSNISTDPPTDDEISKAVRQLKNGKAAGYDGIPPELLKKGGECIISWLQRLFSAIWEAGNIPEDWKRGIILPFYKNKGCRSECKNHRGITLLSVPAKVFSMVILNRIKQPLVNSQRPEQSGFTPGRSTVDRILALRLLAEKRREYRKALFVAYVDLKAAFDSVHRPSLWKLLRARGIPVKIISLIQELYTDTTSCVRVGTNLSDWFKLLSGVRQGCVLAPTLFNIAIDHVMSRTVGRGMCGTTYGEHTFSDMDYADDVALLAELLEALVSTLEIFSAESQTLGLEVSWLKTKLQSLSDFLDPPTCPPINGESVEVVQRFNYLGSVITLDCKSDQDVKRRLGIASAAFASLDRVWRSKHLSRTVKLKIYNTLVLSVLLYGAESWTLTKALRLKLDSFDTRCLRKIEGFRWQDHVTNEVVRRTTNQVPVSQKIIKHQLTFLGHTSRATPTQEVVKLVSAAPDPTWRRPRGRPRSRWEDQVFTVLDTLGVSRADWRALAENRTSWREMSAAAMHLP
ncbi:OIT3 [Branchiostoma lanceolatum]|uniref:OIT3 protein n=1 Tax=Branchiostoma lanceolatum TaxID=7740 RepID=A0A8J9VYT3_BRALA|nr:OIT3 [Branchiostoma lanceolatum]